MGAAFEQAKLDMAAHYAENRDALIADQAAFKEACDGWSNYQILLTPALPPTAGDPVTLLDEELDRAAMPEMERKLRADDDPLGPWIREPKTEFGRVVDPGEPRHGFKVDPGSWNAGRRFFASGGVPHRRDPENLWKRPLPTARVALGIAKAGRPPQARFSIEIQVSGHNDNTGWRIRYVVCDETRENYAELSEGFGSRLQEETLVVKPMVTDEP